MLQHLTEEQLAVHLIRCVQNDADDDELRVPSEIFMQQLAYDGEASASDTLKVLGYDPHSQPVVILGGDRPARLPELPAPAPPGDLDFFDDNSDDGNQAPDEVPDAEVDHLIGRLNEMLGLEADSDSDLRGLEGVAEVCLAQVAAEEMEAEAREDLSSLL